jgi:hypothetical protein
MSFGKSSYFSIFLFFFFFIGQARACDICAIYTSLDQQRPDENTFHFGIAEQFIDYGSVQESGRSKENDFSQHLHSSTTQIYGAYDFTGSFALQLNAPLVNRRFRRVENGVVEKGVESGLGDISIIAKVVPYDFKSTQSSFVIQLFGGVKLPTGSTDRLGEEGAEVQLQDKHGDQGEAAASAVHGHDLSLGSGSYDFPLGAGALYQNKRFLFSGDLQYVIRTEGDFNYQYADDLIWSAGPGYYLSLGHEHTLALKINLSGEYKGKDTNAGEQEGDTGLRALFLGPDITATLGDHLGAELGVDFPLDINNTGFQAVADWKLRAAVSYRF